MADKYIAETPFLIDDNGIYCLKQEGWSNGKPIMVNDIYIRVDGELPYRSLIEMSEVLNRKHFRPGIVNSSDFYQFINRIRHIQGKQREGQFIFNMMWLAKPEITDQLRGTEYDCFHNDELIEKFVNKCFE